MSRIKEQREKLGMTQKALLAELRKTDPRMDEGTLSRIENGFVLPASEAILAALERHLQAPRSDLFEGIEVFAIEGSKAPISRITWLVADAVPFGKKNAIKRADLAEKLGVCDRTMRDWIETARSDGLCIANDQDGKGYYRPETLEEIQRQYFQSRNRTMAQLRQQKWLRARMV